MTDKEKLLALLKEWGVSYKDDPNFYNPALNQVILEANAYADTAKVVGYNGFVTEFTFDKDGKFTNIGIWE